MEKVPLRLPVCLRTFGVGEGGLKMHAMKKGWGAPGYVSFLPAPGSARVLLW